jgi:prophage regulatory protein
LAAVSLRPKRKVIYYRRSDCNDGARNIKLNQQVIAVAPVFYPLKDRRKIVMNNLLTPETDLMNDKLVDMVFITTFTGLTDKWFYKLIKDGMFPRPIKFGRSSRWRESDVRRWLMKRIEESRQ